jgi:hypothetical protein
LLEKTVDVSFEETSVKIAADASRKTPGIDEERPESIDDGRGGFSLETVYPRSTRVKAYLYPPGLVPSP